MPSSGRANISNIINTAKKFDSRIMDLTANMCAVSLNSVRSTVHVQYKNKSVNGV